MSCQGKQPKHQGLGTRMHAGVSMLELQRHGKHLHSFGHFFEMATLQYLQLKKKIFLQSDPCNVLAHTENTAKTPT